jgi:NAD(P)-dependent dehydrogenase (short-subunit alcohol dehydrogenase family)
MMQTLSDTRTDRGVMLITGASRGIGAATARLAAAAGWTVALVYRHRMHEAGELVASIEADGGRAVAIRADVSDERQIMAAFQVADSLGRLTALVNNAGVTGGVSRIEALDAAMLDSLLAINVRAPLLCSREAVKRMSTRHGGAGGSIVNLSSGAAQLGSAGVWVHYAATKGAIDSMTIGMARELGADGLRVNAVRPGPIDTEIHVDRPPGQLDQMARAAPLGRVGTPDEIARVIVWLSDGAQSSYVTAALVDARGGL